MRDLPWFPQARTLREMLYVDRAFWLVAAAGLGWALYRRLWPVAACALALLPVVFYRNSFVYFYVPMWAPACVLFAAAFAGVRELASRGARPMIASVASLSLAALLGAHGLRQLPYLAIPRQDEQRELVAAVHAIFPEPVAYIDHSGMIASFRKANLFMTSWAMQGYLDNGRPFMPTAIARFRPPLLIGNRGELIPGTRVYGRLLAEDRAIIESGYQPYWGNLRIAGAAATIDGSQPVALELPFGGRYRLESLQAVRIDGHLVEPGAVIEVSDDRLKVVASTSTTATSGEPLAMRLLWADARPPPPAPTSVDYYDGL
jgi:hypothetical protein